MSAETSAVLAEVLASHGPGDAAQFIVYADLFLERGERELAAAALDRAYGLTPEDRALARQRAAVLDELAVEEHGLRWRFVPAGTTVMGSLSGDPDERPVHARRVDAFWILDTPITWHDFRRLRGKEPEGKEPLSTPQGRARFDRHQRDKIRMQYCRTKEVSPHDWHTAIESASPNNLDVHPMVATVPSEAEDLVAALAAAQPGVAYALPTEAQWEKAALGGLVGKRYAWGDAAPTPATCDFDHHGDFRLSDPRARAANGYGVFAMCGGVAEWTADLYDALAYTQGGRAAAPTGLAADQQQRVLRGGSWSDCAHAVTVSYRMSRSAERAESPTVGFRLVRTVVRAT